MDPELLNALLFNQSMNNYGGLAPPKPYGMDLPPNSSLTSGGIPPGLDPSSLGGYLDPVPMPRPRPAEAPGGTYAAQSVPGANVDTKGIMGALKGVVSPPPPQVQKVSTPHAPPLARLQGGGVAELLASLGIGPQQAFPGLKLPSTLGQALGG